MLFRSLTDDFDISYYTNNPELTNKYVFKESVESWMGNGERLYDTRLWSFDFQNLKQVTEKMLLDAFAIGCSGLDLEHAYYKVIPKDSVVEKPVVGLKCLVASDGTIRFD